MATVDQEATVIRGRASHPGGPRIALALGCLVLSAAFALVFKAQRGDDSPLVTKSQGAIGAPQVRSAVRELTILPRRAIDCALPYTYAAYKGGKVARHGWSVKIDTTHICIDCPVGPECSPGIYSWAAIAQTSGTVTDNEFATILSARPGAESKTCDGFDSYVIRWEEAQQVKKSACGKMYTFAIKYPIRIRIEPADLTAFGLSSSGEKCSSLEYCKGTVDYLSIYVYKNDARKREVVVPFRVTE